MHFYIFFLFTHILLVLSGSFFLLQCWKCPSSGQDYLILSYLEYKLWFEMNFENFNLLYNIGSYNDKQTQNTLPLIFLIYYCYSRFLHLYLITFFVDCMFPCRIFASSLQSVTLLKGKSWHLSCYQHTFQLLSATGAWAKTLLSPIPAPCSLSCPTSHNAGV